MASVKIKSMYDNHPPHTYAVDLSHGDMVQAQFAAECDVNNILAKYRNTGMITHIAKQPGSFGDFSDVSDYQTALYKIDQAQSAFQQLPSDVRQKFANNPAELITFLADSKNDEEAYKLGLKIRPKKEAEPLQTQMEKALENNDKKRTQKKTSES